ncbi:SAM-dependent methyltransferase [Roseibium sp. HPY-6]|uniref:siroheme synthase family protein n=1 Tax=Roseibium sp. HPY-6 TaxID=3229852 RepID=UPI00338EE4C0
MTPTSPKPVEAVRKRRPARVEALASLPLFFPLKGRKVVLAGGTDAAAWKAELLAAGGAHVHVFAEQLDDTFSALLSTGSVSGRFTHHDRPWSLGDFNHAAVAIADAASDGEAQAFYCAARSAGIPVNVIDKPAFCDFQFGSIVNRSPVVIGISTDGAAPILGQAIRRRIETLLPASLQDWAVLARKVRAKVLSQLSAGAERRRFWEGFTDLAFSGREAAETAEGRALDPLFQEASQVSAGRVTIVGAGPGDAEHLTLKAMRTLQSADVILFDDRVDNTVLELARREAKRMLVGRNGDGSKAEGTTSDRMVMLARQGKHVVHLKSGDLSSGEAETELQRLQEAGIPASVVPGVAIASYSASNSERRLQIDDAAAG